MFTAAAKVAAILGHASQTDAESLNRFAANIGFAFQIVDDILEVIGEEKLVGKQSDQGKMNFVKIVGMEKARQYLNDYHKKAEEALKPFGEKAQALKEFSAYLIERVRW